MSNAARRRAGEIRARLESLTENLEQIPAMVQAAYEQQDWQALGYESWTDYVHAEYGTQILRLSAAVRREWSQRLSDGGMSTRAIAPVVNASFKTVARDLETVSFDTAEPIEGPRTRTEEIIWCEAEADRLEEEAERLRWQAARFKAQSRAYRITDAASILTMTFDELVEGK